MKFLNATLYAQLVENNYISWRMTHMYKLQIEDSKSEGKYRALSGTSHGPRKATIIGNAVTTLKILQSAIQYAIHGRRPAAAAK